MNLTCIMCPIGCQLSVTKKKGEIVVTGNSCVRGERYGKQEVVAPKRIVTTVAKTKNGVVSVKTNNPVDKHRVDDVVKEISKLVIENPKHGQIVIENVLGLGADVVVTGGK